MAPLPSNEAARLEALHQTHLLDTPPTEAFDDLTRLAAQICGVPIAAVTLVDSERQWFKSILGLSAQETPRDGGFCAHSILQPDLLVIPDALADERFADNPLVTGDPNIRFYAGAPLITPEGYAIGSLCVIDRIPRSLTVEQVTALQTLARQAAGQVELVRRLAQQEQLIADRAAAQEIIQRSEGRLLEAQRVAKIGSWEYEVATGRITWSAEMFRLLDFDPALGEPDYETLETHYHPVDAAIHSAVVQQAIQTGQPYEIDIRVTRQDGLICWVHAVGQASWDEAGRVTRLFGTVMDITERKQAEEENARMAAIIESSHDAVVGTTLEGMLVSWNKSAENLFGYRECEIIGQHASVLAAPEDRGFTEAIIAALLRGERCENRKVQGRRKGGACVDIVMTYSPIRNPIGEMVGVAAIGRDVTAHRLAEEAVRRSEARLVEAQRVAKIGSWEVDMVSREITFSAEMYRLFDLDPAAGMPPLADLLAKYHPEDVAGHQALVAQSRTDLTPFVTRLRIVRPGGEIRWCHVVGEPILDEQGNLLRQVGTMMDITEGVLVEERFRVLFEHSSEAHFLVSGTGIVDCNQAALQMLRCPDKNTLLALHPTALSPEFQPNGDRSCVMGPQMDAAALEKGVHRFEWVHCRVDGEEFPAEITLTPVSLNGKPAMLSVWHDLTERKRAEQQIRDYSVILEFQKQELEQANRELCSLATTDGLTGLKNHRAFQERLPEECETALRHQNSLSVLLLDVDHFKQYNDAFGHPAGDEVLRQVAALLVQTMRECDFVARYGGEEFIIILPQTDHAGALRAAERCRAAIETADWSFRPVTASFGVSTLSLACSTSPLLIAAADQALYAAKFNGRNQVMSAASLCLLRS